MGKVDRMREIYDEIKGMPAFKGQAPIATATKVKGLLDTMVMYKDYEKYDRVALAGAEELLKAAWALCNAKHGKGE